MCCLWSFLLFLTLILLGVYSQHFIKNKFFFSPNGQLVLTLKCSTPQIEDLYFLCIAKKWFFCRGCVFFTFLQKDHFVHALLSLIWQIGMYDFLSSLDNFHLSLHLLMKNFAAASVTSSYFWKQAKETGPYSPKKFLKQTSYDFCNFRSQSYQTLISSFLWFSLLSLAILKYRHYFSNWETGRYSPK